MGARADIAGCHHIVYGFLFRQRHKKIEPMDAGVDNIPAAALDLHQFQLPDLPVVYPFQDLAGVVRHQKAMGHRQREISGPYKLQQLTAVGEIVRQRLFNEDAPQRQAQSGAGPPPDGKGGQVETHTTSVGHSLNISS